MDMMNPGRVEEASSNLVDAFLSSLGPKSYSESDLMSFTSDFSNEIGSGGYGVVYKGQFPSGDNIAVKVLAKGNSSEETFMAEVGTMGKASHHNLIELYGYCFEHNTKALVYEYMENGSLDKILYEKHHGNIEWEKLYSIAIEIAKGLNYLHDDLDKQIIHYDIKASNVLLDDNFSPKITDFGLAKLVNRDLSCSPLTRVIGTVGYNAPETWMPGSQVSSKCDVFSFGMLLFEILGKRNNGVGENWFPMQVWKQFEKGNLEHMIRHCGITEKDIEKANILSQVALWCAQDKSELRPRMKHVVLMLEKELEVEKPSCPFLLGQFTNPSMLQSQDVIPQVYFPSRHNRVHLDKVKELANFRRNKGMKLPTPRLVGKTTALMYSKMVMEWIQNNETTTIGIHGMGGVGKTTILKDVYNQLIAERNCFDKIFWITVSKDANISKLQHDIAKAVDLNLPSGDDILQKSRLLLYALEQRKRVVLVMDDMWQAISLVEIGIPQPTQKNGWKLLLTTRSLDVCKRMGCQEHNTITVEPLPEDEAWDLFTNTVEVALTDSEVMDVAKQVVKECSGLPLAIITVGAAMRGNHGIITWRAALKDLEDFTNRITDMEDSVFEHLRFSYDRLANEKLRKCFLYCALYPEDYEIPTSELVLLWSMDDLIKEKNRQNEAYQSQFILQTLKDHCLLESVNIDVDNKVKMHDLVRDMALRITSNSFMVHAGVLLKCLPNETEWGEVLERASFMDNFVQEVSISPRCLKLSTLFLNGNFLRYIENDFFVNMQCLRVLDIRENSRVECLPNSISDLVNLRALRLGGCWRLQNVPSLAKLVLLRLLELDGTSIEELPEGIERLVNLRWLSLKSVQLRLAIPTGLISKFSELQTLDLGCIHADKVYFGSGTSFAEELLSLKELENLYMNFHCLSDYSSYVRSADFHGLKNFFLKIGTSTRLIYDPFECARTMKFTYTTKIDHITRNSISILENTQTLRIVGFNDLRCFYRWERLNELQDFCVQSCHKIECIWMLVKGIPNIGILSFLKRLGLDNCHNLKSVFSSFRVLQLFQNLEEIFVKDCHKMEEFIKEDSRNAITTITLPRLKNLTMNNLWNLKSIWKGVMVCDSLEYVCVRDCWKLNALPQLKGKEQYPPPALKEIEGYLTWWDSLEWDPAYPRYILQPFLKELSTDSGESSFEDGEENFQSDEEESS